MVEDLRSNQQKRDDLTDYKIDELQKSLNTLNTAVASLSTQIMTLQVSLPDRFLTRLEFAEILRQKEIQQQDIDRRLNDNALNLQSLRTEIRETNDHWLNRGATLLAALIASSVAIIIGVVDFVSGLSHVISTTVNK